MATTRTENVGPVIMGLSKQNGQLRGQTKAASVQSASATQGKALGPSQTPAGAPQDGGGIKFGDDWKRNLKLPPKDNRVRTSVSPHHFILLLFLCFLLESWRLWSPSVGCDGYQGEWIWRLLPEKRTPHGHFWDGLGETVSHPGMFQIQLAVLKNVDRSGNCPHLLSVIWVLSSLGLRGIFELYIHVPSSEYAVDKCWLTSNAGRLG